jgi:outer membrane immunogenic protein
MRPIKFKLIFFNLLLLAGISDAYAQDLQFQPQPFHSEFAGPYVGIKLGENWSNASGAINIGTHASTFFGAMAGYGFDIGHLVLGAEAFADFHNNSTTNDDGGMDVRIGIPLNKIMPYARVGFTGIEPNTRFHGGLGIEYALYKNIHVNVEWTADTSNSNGIKRKSNSVTLGLTYYFR